MRSPQTLTHWCQQLLPHASDSARAAGRDLVLALLCAFTTNLTQLGRQTDREHTGKSNRQRLARWLEHAAWDPVPLYTGLARLTRRWLRRGSQVLLLIDTTHLSDRWVVLQVSVPWQRRALPLYRVVYPYAGPERDQGAALAQALDWLRHHLPGPRDRYVLVMDRGFPSTEWVRVLQASRWRFVLRVKGHWRLECAEYTGQLRHDTPDGEAPRWYADAVLGWRDARLKGPDPRGRAHVVQSWEAAHQEPWCLVTTEPTAAAALQIYVQRMQIEQEFRDVKGETGLDGLADWHDEDRIARFLAWLAVYEWRLAFYWLFAQLGLQAPHYQVRGKLSWIRLTREWFARQLRLLGRTAPACL
jgi:hypothetical protein